MSRLLIAFLLVAILARGLCWLSGKLAPYGLAYNDGDTVILLGFGWQVIRQCWYWWLAAALVPGLLVLTGYGLGSLENRWQRKRIQQLLKTLNDQSQRLAPFMDHDRTPHPPWSGRIDSAPLALLEMPDNRFAETLRKLRQELGSNKEDFNQVMQPVLLRYAAYVHRLPASTGAYREPGGLLRQGLDNAVATVRRGRETVLAHGFPGQQERQKPQWLLACALVGLLTEVGKTLLKWTVSDPDDRHRWQPHQQPLADWLEKNDLSEYALRPASDQGPPLGSLLVERILKPEGWSALDADIQGVLLEILGGTSSHPLATLAREVYRHNREQDRQAGQEVSPPASSDNDQQAGQVPERVATETASADSDPQVQQDPEFTALEPTYSDTAWESVLFDDKPPVTVQEPSAVPSFVTTAEVDETQPAPPFQMIDTPPQESTPHRQEGHGLPQVPESKTHGSPSTTFPRR